MDINGEHILKMLISFTEGKCYLSEKELYEYRDIIVKDFEKIIDKVNKAKGKTRHIFQSDEYKLINKLIPLSDEALWNYEYYITEYYPELLNTEEIDEDDDDIGYDDLWCDNCGGTACNC